MSLVTERLRLIPPSIDLVPEIHDYFNRNRAFLAPWRPIPEEDSFTSEYQEERLRDELTLVQQGRMLKYWLQCRVDHCFIGQICFSQINRGSFQSCFLGYSLDKDYLCRGYMTEGLREAVRIAFDEEILHRIEANIMPRNLVSIRVVEKLGFHSEGTEEQYLKINGIWEDHTHMVLLNPDY